MTSSAPAHPTELLVGTYTETLPHVAGKATGVGSMPVDATGAVGALRPLAEVRNPSWVAVSSAGDRVYSVVETVEFEGAPGGGVTAFHRSADGTLTPLNTAPSGGVEPAHLALDPSERYLLVANYRSGSVAVFALTADGGLADRVDHVQHGGSSVHPVRQTGPHAHQIVFDPITGDVWVPDLGQDAVINYAFHEGRLTEQADRRLTTEPGAGPRHLAFDRTGAFLFLLNELDNTLEVHRRDGDTFVRTGRASTLPAGFTGHSQASAVRVSVSGDLVLVSNRGPETDSIAVFRFDSAHGSAALVHTEPSRGREPRDFLQSPDGRILWVANQDTDTVETFLVDETAATLDHLGSTAVPTPVCLVLAP